MSETLEYSARHFKSIFNSKNLTDVEASIISPMIHVSFNNWLIGMPRGIVTDYEKDSSFRKYIFVVDGKIVRGFANTIDINVEDQDESWDVIKKVCFNSRYSQANMQVYSNLIGFVKDQGLDKIFELAREELNRRKVYSLHQEIREFYYV